MLMSAIEKFPGFLLELIEKMAKEDVALHEQGFINKNLYVKFSGLQ